MYFFTLNSRRYDVTCIVHHNIVHTVKLRIVRFEQLRPVQSGAHREDELMFVQTNSQFNACNLRK